MRVLVLLLVVLLSAPAQAHGGGVDKYGCHVDSRTGQRHCHRDDGGTSPPAQKDGMSTGEIVLVASVAAALVGVGVYFLVKARSDPFSLQVAAAPSGILVTGTF